MVFERTWEGRSCQETLGLHLTETMTPQAPGLPHLVTASVLSFHQETSAQRIKGVTESTHGSVGGLWYRCSRPSSSNTPKCCLFFQVAPSSCGFSTVSSAKDRKWHPSRLFLKLLFSVCECFAYM